MQTLAYLALALACASAGASDATPIGKAIQLLSDLQSKIVAEGAEAQKVFDEASEFCEDRSRALGFDIKAGKSEVKELKASIAEETALIGSLNAKIEELASSIATDEADLKAAMKIRKTEATDFEAEQKQLLETTDMLGRAVGVLQKEMNKGGASMLQLKDAGSIAQALEALVHASALSSADGAKLTALVQATQQSADEASDAGLGAPDGAVYESHSGDIIATLGSLMEKAEDQLADARKKETTSIQNFEMVKQSLEDSIKFATKDTAEAKKSLAASSETKATAEGSLAATTKDLSEDTKALADLHQDCMTKATEFEAATKSRNDEVKAITAAKKVLLEKTGAADKISYGLSQTAFVQTGRSSLASRADLAKFEAVRLIRDLAHKQHSPALTQLAMSVASALHSTNQDGNDIFAKVKTLISDMIGKLEDEAAADASHKAFCDKELAETMAKKAEKDTKIEKLTIKIEQMVARSSKLKEEVAAIQKSLAELAEAQAEMDKLRVQEHELFVKGKADMEQGLEGVKLALKVLREYYAQASGAHAAAKGAGSGIIGLLEVVESDMSQTLAGLVATEEGSKSSYEAETKENEIEKASKEQDAKYKTKEATQLDKETAEATSDRSSEQSELDSAMEYLKGLNKQCTTKPMSYEERKSRREAELAGLQQALAILEGETAFIQRQAKRTLRGVQPHHSLA